LEEYALDTLEEDASGDRISFSFKALLEGFYERLVVIGVDTRDRL
jgi:hypothetical protein